MVSLRQTAARSKLRDKNSESKTDAFAKAKASVLYSEDISKQYILAIFHFLPKYIPRTCRRPFGFYRLQGGGDTDKSGYGFPLDDGNHKRSQSGENTLEHYDSIGAFRGDPALSKEGSDPALSFETETKCLCRSRLQGTRAQLSLVLQKFDWLAVFRPHCGMDMDMDRSWDKKRYCFRSFSVGLSSEIIC